MLVEDSPLMQGRGHISPVADGVVNLSISADRAQLAPPTRLGAGASRLNPLDGTWSMANPRWYDARSERKSAQDRVFYEEWSRARCITSGDVQPASRFSDQCHTCWGHPGAW